MELIARDIKQAGFGTTKTIALNPPVGGTAGNCTAGGTAVPIRPVDNNSAIPLTAVNDTGADSISFVVPRTNPSWYLNSPAPAGAVTSTITLSAAAVAEMVTEGMQNGSGAYISLGGALTLSVVSSTGATITVANPIMAPLFFPGSPTQPGQIGPGGFPAVGTQVYLLQCVTYQVQTGAGICGTAGPCLTRTVDSGTAPTITTPLVDGVEDLQFAFGCDGCNGTASNGVIDDFNGNGTLDQADFQTNRVWTAGIFDPATIRLVQINIVARQTAIDQGTGEGVQAASLSSPLQVSDHLPSMDAGYVAATYQSFRRRFLTRTVDTRNMR
jgi:type IV pilus assembly protein PilW